MSPARWTVLVAAAALLAVAGCGDDEGSSSETTPTADAAYVDRANAICRDGLREAEQLGRTIQRRVDPDSDLDVISQAVIRPGIPLLEGQGERLRRVAAEADSPALTAYVELYDPAAELARQRLSAGKKGNVTAAQEITALMQELGAEARVAAREAGLRDCDLDFQSAVVNSAAGQ